MARLATSKDFKVRCRDRVLEVFASLGGEAPTFRALRGDLEYLSGDFQHEGRTYTIEIYDENVLVQEGKHRYECYLREEWVSEESLLNGFASRLTRLLSGGPWAAPGEGSFLSRVGAAIKKLT